MTVVCVKRQPDGKMAATNIPKEIADKIADYHSIGVDCVWVADPDAKTIAVHPKNGPVMTIAESGEINGGDYLPGFRAKVFEFFDVS